MASSQWPPAAGAVLTPSLEEATPAATTSEGGGVAAAAPVPLQQDEEEAKLRLPRDDDSEAEIQEHGQKIKKYRAILAARLKAKLFSKKAFDGGNIFEAVTVVQGETIQSSRWPCTRSFANPEFFSRDKNIHEKGSSSSAADFSAKNNSPSLAVAETPTVLIMLFGKLLHQPRRDILL
ncbi:hypothetical protein QOZ80_6AG0538480 [Eleusine coracana subsp. coracana]|nr:hypothetical protein QOZ80_6AG0538480 [Eleusine coracana subsp. coracana]